MSLQHFVSTMAAVADGPAMVAPGKEPPPIP